VALILAQEQNYLVSRKVSYDTVRQKIFFPVIQSAGTRKQEKVLDHGDWKMVK